MKYLIFLFTLMLGVDDANAQVTGTITVNGDIDKFYPVKFYDGARSSNRATELEIGRSNVHTDSLWRGSIISKFRYHVTGWGNGSSFIDADIKQANPSNPTIKLFIGGWRDVTFSSASGSILIWMRGKSTYFYTSNYAVLPAVYDGVQNPLIYVESGSTTHTFKTTIDSYVNVQGTSQSNAAYFNGVTPSYFGGSVGIGTHAPAAYKLAVEGTIGARKVKVTKQANWADFVFEPEYQLPSLPEVDRYIKTNRHLPGIPTESDVKENGIDLGEMNAKLLQKIEELTLYLIEQEKRAKIQQGMIDTLRMELNQLRINTE